MRNSARLHLQELDQGRGRAAAILEMWDDPDERLIDAAIREWCKRLHACIAADRTVQICSLNITHILLKCARYAFEEEMMKSVIA